MEFEFKIPIFITVSVEDSVNFVEVEKVVHEIITPSLREFIKDDSEVLVKFHELLPSATYKWRTLWDIFEERGKFHKDSLS